jgi:hypothetical protein
MPQSKSSRLVPWLLVILPVWLIASGIFAMVKYFHKEESDQIEAVNRLSKEISIPSLTDDLEKIITRVGERNTSKPEQLNAIASMIKGTLGPSNTGYSVTEIDGPANFPLLLVTISAGKTAGAPVWILTSYDSPAGSRGAESNASGLVATLAAAQSLANTTSSGPIHFLFIPHANQTAAPVLETANLTADLIKRQPKARAILCVEAMGAGESLILSSRDTEALPVVEFKDLGTILGAEIICLGEDSDLSSTLFEMNLPAIRVSTRPILLAAEADEKIPFAPTLAASTGRLIELIRRLAK